MNSYGMPNVAPNVFVKGGRFPSGGETYASPMNAGMAAFPIPIFDLPLKTSIIPRNSGGVPTFIRATTATLDDWEGIVRTALSGEARFNGARRVRNLLLATEALTGGSWGTTFGGTGVAASCTAGFLAPDGTPTAFRVQANRGVGNTGADFSSWNASVVSPWDTGQIWIKSNIPGVTQHVHTSFTAAGSTVMATPDWRRVAFTNFTPSTTFDIGTQGTISTNNSVDVLVWHPQAERTTGQSNLNPSEYVSVGVLAAPYQGANVDGVQYFDVTNPNTVVGGVIVTNPAISAAIANCTYWAEGARTNLAIQSEDFSNVAWVAAASSVSANAIIAPDGNLTADKLVEDGTIAFHTASQTIAFTTGLTYVFSCFVKAGERNTTRIQLAAGAAIFPASAFGDFNLALGTVAATGGGAVSASIVAYANGWYRCIVTATAIGTGNSTAVVCIGTASTQGDNVSGIYAWGADVEQASFASKYIATVAATVTRNADQLSYPAAGNIVNAAGTSYAEVTLTSGTSGQMPVIVDDAFTSVALYHHNANTLAIFDGTNLVNSQVWTETTLQKLATSWGSTGIKTCKAGGAIASGVFDGAMNFTNVINIGSPIGAQALFGGIRNVRIWDRQLTDAQLTAFTAATFTAFS